MEIETDIKLIELLSQQREDANWAFRCFLKGSTLSVAKIDSKVHDLYKKVSAQIDCTQCGNCCKVIQPNLSVTDIKRLARQFESTTKAFRSLFVMKNDRGEGFVFNEQPCPFLKDNRCAVYENRPRDCRSYPHLHKKEFVFRINQAVSNCSICPIVFNVFEELKQAFWPTRFKWPMSA
jgi:Fe-S-cluster containining protein